MTWEKWLLIGFYALGTLLSISTIGKPRKPLTPGLAVAIVIVNAALTVCVVFA